MNASTTKDQLTFSLGNLSYIDGSYDEQLPAPSVETHKRGLGHLIEGLRAKLDEWRHHRQVVAELAAMTDRELADIGLSRYDLSRVFDRAFAADHANKRDYIGY